MSANKKAKIQPSVLSYFTSSSRDKVTSPDTEETAFVFEGLESQEISHDDTEPVSGLTQLLPSASVSLPDSQDAPPVVNFGVSVPAVITSQGEHFHKNRVFRAEWQLQHPLASTLHDKERGLVPVLCMGRFGGQVSRVHQGC